MNTFFFINNDYKIECGEITAIKYYMKNNYGLKDYDNIWNEPQNPITYTIQGVYDRNENKVFKTRDELIKSL